MPLSPSSSPQSPALSIFYPAHNEAKNLESLIEHAAEFVKLQSFAVEVIVVDDGSSDETPTVLAALMQRYPFLRTVRHEKNLGYGEALKTGFRSAKAPRVFFTDGDHQFRLNALPEFLQTLDSEPCDVVVGYRRNRQDNVIRKLNGYLWSRMIRLVLGVKIRDIDCAYKLFRKPAIEALEVTTTGAMISAELLYQIQQNNFRIVERPVEHHPRTQGASTGGNLHVIARAFKELFQFYSKSRARS